MKQYPKHKKTLRSLTNVGNNIQVHEKNTDVLIKHVNT